MTQDLLLRAMTSNITKCQAPFKAPDAIKSSPQSWEGGSVIVIIPRHGNEEMNRAAQVTELAHGGGGGGAQKLCL